MFGGTRRFFSDERWALVGPLVEQMTRRGPKGAARRFLEAIAWILRSGAPWRDLAKELGPWERVYRRFRRWALAGTWERLRRAISLTTAFRYLRIDSTSVKAHPHSAGASKRDGRQALGRSRGGFTTKLHAVVTERAELVRYVVTGGEVADITQARGLVRHRSTAVLADRAYDSDGFIAHVGGLGAEAVIPSTWGAPSRPSRRAAKVSAAASPRGSRASRRRRPRARRSGCATRRRRSASVPIARAASGCRSSASLQFVSARATSDDCFERAAPRSCSRPSLTARMGGGTSRSTWRPPSFIRLAAIRTRPRARPSASIGASARSRSWPRARARRWRASRARDLSVVVFARSNGRAKRSVARSSTLGIVIVLGPVSRRPMPAWLMYDVTSRTERRANWPRPMAAW